jgi:hypothetical protein
MLVTKKLTHPIHSSFRILASPSISLSDREGAVLQFNTKHNIFHFNVIAIPNKLNFSL